MFEPKDDEKEMRRHRREAEKLAKRAKGRDDEAQIKAHADWHELIAQLHHFHAYETRYPRRKK